MKYLFFVKGSKEEKQGRRIIKWAEREVNRGLKLFLHKEALLASTNGLLKSIKVHFEFPDNLGQLGLTIDADYKQTKK